MNQNRALEVIQSLASGLDPLTSKAFPANHLLQNSQIVRALFAAAEALRSSSTQINPPKIKDSPAAAGKPWTKAEDQQLASAFDGGATEKDLVAKHQRTRGAIRARLVKLGRLDASAYARRQPAAAPGIAEPRVSH